MSENGAPAEKLALRPVRVSGRLYLERLNEIIEMPCLARKERDFHSGDEKLAE